MSEIQTTGEKRLRHFWRPFMQRPWAVVALAAALVFIAFNPETAAEAALFALDNLLIVSPMIIIGVSFTAGITASGSMAIISAAFKGRELRMIIVASLIGAITPVCGVTVLPLVAALIVARVPLAPIMAFWLSSPITDPGMLAVTAGTLGLSFAVGKTLAAFGAGVFGGALTLLLTRAGHLAEPGRTAILERTAAQACGSFADEGICWRFWMDPDRLAAFRATAFATARLMLMWLGAAFVAEYFLHAILPADLLSAYVGSEQAFAVPLAALIGAPIYLDGYAALPLIRGLVDGGMGQGAAMAFLVAGGIISAYAAIPVFALVRLPVFALYVALAIASAMLAGWGFAAIAG